ncbi:MAG TPA: transglycosylase domain-containing protein [Thermoleophilaceae bacterium]|nr:transglycosylase domain-containing protein [Thermoleophilaceae bacterium]
MQEPPTPTLTRPPAQGAEPAALPPPPPVLRPRLKKLRLALILLGLGVLALISTVFGMMMAVASDLPALENRAEYRAAKNSILLPDHGNRPIAQLTGNHDRILLDQSQISPYIKGAVIATEDQRFYHHQGVDYRGIARALWADVLRRNAAQGGSTITQQFVKNALSAEANRSVFEKLREAALAYHLERKWSKQKILTEYLNTVYFGNGAYGVESAARTYFASHRGRRPGGPGTAHPVAEEVTPAQAALLAGMIASPSAYDPVEHPRAALARRNHVLDRMLGQHYITRAEYARAKGEPIPTQADIDPPRPDSEDPYFSTWLTQQLVDRYGSGLVFGGGLKIRTTLDPKLQRAAEEAIAGRLSGVGPDAALVAIDNKTGEIRAMVGGPNYERRPFNLATDGYRQPGSAFKPFTLLAALEHGVSPDATFASRPKVFPVPGSGGKEKFVVRNYDNDYSGAATLRDATAASDNSVFAELGLGVGTRKIARLARRMGITTPVSTNPAMTLGGLKEGLTPLELAYAYTTIANKGLRVSGTLAGVPDGPVAIESVEGHGRDARDEKRVHRVFPAWVGETAQELLTGVIQGGTGKAADIGEFAAGKTGTTENYGDAWFVGFNRELTVAVWVGYADHLKPMKTEYHGGPVAGGTYPAEIWHDFMTSWIQIRDERRARRGEPPPPSETAPAAPPEQTPYPAGEGQDTTSQPSPLGAGEQATPTEQAPQPSQQAPQPSQQTPSQQAPPQQPPSQQAPSQPAQPPQQAPTPGPEQPPAAGGQGGTGAPR